jgi:hypothetical protein
MSYFKSVNVFLALPLMLSMVSGEGACQSGKSGRGGGVVAASSTRVPAGTWGSQEGRANLDVTDKGAAIDFDCARGEVREPLVLDARNRFSAPGVYIKEHGGPEREGEDAGQSARYEGHVSGETMTLTIKLSGSDQSVGPLNFTFGKRVRLFKCQ